MAQINVVRKPELVTLYGLTDEQKKTYTMIAAGAAVGIVGFFVIRQLRKRKRGR